MRRDVSVLVGMAMIVLVVAVVPNLWHQHPKLYTTEYWLEVALGWGVFSGLALQFTWRIFQEPNIPYTQWCRKKMVVKPIPNCS